MMNEVRLTQIVLRGHTLTHLHTYLERKPRKKKINKTVEVTLRSERLVGNMDLGEGYVRYKF